MRFFVPKGRGLSYFSAAYDYFAWVLAVFLALALRYEFDFLAISVVEGGVVAASLGLAFVFAGFFTHLYTNRYISGSVDELRALLKSLVFAALLVGIPLLFLGQIWGIPRSLVMLAAPVFLLISGALRAYLRFGRLQEESTRRDARRAVVYGAGFAAQKLIPQLLEDPDSPYIPVVLLDDAPEKKNRWISGVPMGGSWEDLESVVADFNVDVVIVAIPTASSALLSRVYEVARALELGVVVLPTLREYLGGLSSVRQLRDVGIEDLVGRQTVDFDPGPVKSLLEGKKVVVTGAGGSIGTELVSQIAEFSPLQLTLVDRDETLLLMASIGLEKRAECAAYNTHLLDIRDREAVKSLFETYRPDVVFHAAALKHLPMLERFPREAWKTNVEGTLNLLESSRDFGVSVFVNISTDKAANPTSVLGRSKRLAEQLTAWFGLREQLPFVSVRFGNVLGSRGSLVPLLADQIDSGGPITLTDNRATRFFMSVKEACQLVLQAAASGESGDVMVLDMGAPVRIQEIAERMRDLSGKTVPITYTGLRPGEKLHEILLSDEESPLPSSHPKMMRLRVEPKSPAQVQVDEF